MRTLRIERREIERAARLDKAGRKNNPALKPTPRIEVARGAGRLFHFSKPGQPRGLSAPLTPNQKSKRMNKNMNKLQSFIAARPGGFLKDTDMPALIALDRLCPVLVRCGGCRFTCGAQYLDHMEACIRAGGDYVRDVSFPVGALEAAASWQPEMLPASVQRAVTARAIIPHPATRRIVVSNGTMFNEADCGGVFDGFGVTSDADPGL